MLFTEAEIKERFEDFYDLACGFCDDYNDRQTVKAEIDPSLLYLCVVSIYDDISRYKEYHLTDPKKQRSNSIKRAAYGAKWITHFSPVIFPQMGHETGQAGVENGDALANAVFALHFALTNVEIEAEASFQLSNEYYYQLVYDLTYRGLTADALILFFQSVADLANPKRGQAYLVE